MTPPAPIRIGFVCLTGGINRRGVETWVQEVSGRLAARGHSVTVVQGGPPDAAAPAGVRTIVHRSRFPAGVSYRLRDPNRWLAHAFLDINSLRTLRFALRALPGLLREAPDILFVMTGSWTLPAMRLLRRWRGTRLAIVGHAGIGPDDAWNLRHRPDLYVATTGPVQEWADARRPAGVRTATIPSGTDCARFRDAAPEDPFANGAPTILCPAALVPYKRIHLAIEATARLQRGNLLLLGHGPLESDLRALGERLLGDRFRIASVPADRVHGYFRAARVVTLPSHPVENAPLVYAEAMAAGAPVVTTDFDRARWILGGAAIYVDPTDAGVYAGALGKAMEDGAHRESLVRAARERAAAFDWEAVVGALQREVERTCRERDGVCAVCGSSRTRTALDGGAFRAVRCLGCDLVRTQPDPVADYLAVRGAESAVEAERRYGETRDLWRHFAARTLAAVRRHRAGGRLLDVGCDVGHFLEAARANGFAGTGLETSPGAAAFVRERLGIEVIAGTLEDTPLPAGAYDVVTMTHVLEHTADPVGVLRRVRTLLAPGGIALVNVPNFASLARRMEGRGWYGLQPAEHRWQFEPASLAAMLSRAGFEVRETFTGTMHRFGGRGMGSLAARAARRVARAVGLGDDLFAVAAPR